MRKYYKNTLKQKKEEFSLERVFKDSGTTTDYSNDHLWMDQKEKSLKCISKY